MSAIEKKRENPALLEDERLATPPTETEATEDPVADAKRVSDSTNIHDAGSDANNTPDGLTETEEAVRRAAEDVPTGQSPTGKTDSVPVFDRSSLPPKV
jgi:hypothetical protein